MSPLYRGRGVMSVETRLSELGLHVPDLPPPAGEYLPVRRAGNLLFASGQTPTVAGVLSMRGRVGHEVSLNEAIAGARLATLNCLAEIRAGLGSLDRVLHAVKLTGYVAAASGFDEHPRVLDGASRLMVEIFGDNGRHARAVVGVASLPGGSPVEVELLVLVRNRR